MDLMDFILNSPALAPPPGVASNFDNPSNQTGLVVSTMTFFLVLSTLTILLRAYSRVAIIRKFNLDDFFVFAGYGLFVSFTYCIYTLSRGVGFFVHQWDIRVKDTKDMLYYIHFSACFYAMSVMCLKVAILLEWTRIFSPHGISRRFSRICYTLMVINICFYTASVIASALSCRPYKRIWDKLVPGTCINTMILDVTSSAINVLSNIIILLLPQHIIWRLQMTLKRKIGVALVFGVGIICVASALGRLVVTVEYFQSPDVSYHVSAVGIWCLSEMTCLLIVCCCPTISKIFNESQLFSRVFSSLQSLRGTRQSRNDASVELSNSKDDPTPLVNTYRKIETGRGLS